MIQPALSFSFVFRKIPAFVFNITIGRYFFAKMHPLKSFKR